MKVLRLIGGMDPGFGGPSVSSMNSSIAARRAGVETHFAFPSDPALPVAAEDAKARLAAENISSTTFPLARFPAGLARRWGMSSRLTRWARRAAMEFDIVHCHSAWVMPTLSQTGSGNRPWKRVLSPHEGLTTFDMSQGSAGPTSFLKRMLKPRILNSFDAVIMSSELEARDSIPAGMSNPPRIETIHHPVFDERARSPALRPDWQGPGLTVGFFGRLHQKKNLNLLIRALADCGPEVSLLVGGDGPERDALRRLAAECEVTSKIDWLGFVAAADKRAFFDRIDLLAMPSDYECFGMAAAEALVEGCPVLVTPETGISEILTAHDCGIVTQANAGEIAAAIEKLRAEPVRHRQYSTNATKAAAESLSFGAHGAALKRVYEGLFDNQNG